MEAQPLRERVVRGEHSSAEHVAVAAEELGRAVDDEVGTELERTLQHRARERAVDGDQRARTVHELADRVEVDDAEQRIGRELEPDQAGAIGHRRGDRVGIGRIDRGEGQPVAPEDLVEEPEGAAVHVLGEDDVIPGIEEQHHRRRCRQSRREREAVVGALERREALLEVAARRIAGARVLESLVPSGRLLRERGRQVDRERPRRRSPGRGPGRRAGRASPGRAACAARRSAASAAGDELEQVAPGDHADRDVALDDHQRGLAAEQRLERLLDRRAGGDARERAGPSPSTPTW